MADIGRKAEVGTAGEASSSIIVKRISSLDPSHPNPTATKWKTGSNGRKRRRSISLIY